MDKKVTYKEILNQEFMNKYSRKPLEEILRIGGVKDLETFVATTDDVLDKVVWLVTDFTRFQDMLAEAKKEYLEKHPDASLDHL